jgi:hypothetical protein
LERLLIFIIEGMYRFVIKDKTDEDVKSLKK